MQGRPRSSRGLAVTRWQRVAPREHALEALRPRPGARADECQHRMHVVEAAEAVVDAGAHPSASSSQRFPTWRHRACRCAIARRRNRSGPTPRSSGRREHAGRIPPARASGRPSATWNSATCHQQCTATIVFAAQPDSCSFIQRMPASARLGHLEDMRHHVVCPRIVRVQCQRFPGNSLGARVLAAFLQTECMHGEQRIVTGQVARPRRQHRLHAVAQAPDVAGR